MTQKTANFITFDIEEWYAANYGTVDLSQFSDESSHLEKNVDKLLDICDEHDVKSTCFIVGDIAENKPHIVKAIHQRGHEIASHSYAHGLIYEMSPDEFRKDLAKSCNMLEQIIGEKVVGFRAPSWSVREDTLPWFYQILEEQGLVYSSSVFPGKTYLYGIPGFPQEIHRPLVDGHQFNIWEIPQTLFSFAGIQIGFSGGFYLRFFPYWFVKRQIKRSNNAGKSVFIYLHPREIDPDSPKLKLPLLEKMIHYYGVKGCEKKFRRILGKFDSSFVRMSDFINKSKF